MVLLHDKLIILWTLNRQKKISFCTSETSMNYNKKKEQQEIPSSLKNILPRKQWNTTCRTFFGPRLKYGNLIFEQECNTYVVKN